MYRLVLVALPAWIVSPELNPQPILQRDRKHQSGDIDGAISGYRESFRARWASGAKLPWQAITAKRSLSRLALQRTIPGTGTNSWRWPIINAQPEGGQRATVQASCNRVTGRLFYFCGLRLAAFGDTVKPSSNCYSLPGNALIWGPRIKQLESGQVLWIASARWRSAEARLPLWGTTASRMTSRELRRT